MPVPDSARTVLHALHEDLDKEKFERVRVNRHNLQSAVRDKTSSLQMQWLGSDPTLKTTAVGRLAYAVGAGATDLAEVLSQLQVMTRELEIDDFEFKVKRWREQGQSSAGAYAGPTTKYRITAVFLKGPSSYAKWRKKTGEAEVELIPRPDSAKPRKLPSRRRSSQPIPDYTEDISDTSSVSGMTNKRSLPRDSEAAKRPKVTKSRKGATETTQELRRTPTPVGLDEGELNVIDGSLVLRIPISKAESYRGRTMTSRLQLQSDDQMTDDVIRYLAASAQDSTAQKLAKSGIISVHNVVQGLMKTGDLRRSNELAQTTELPPTAEWRLQTPSSYCFENPQSDFRPQPIRLPQLHPPHTPDKVECHSLLPTTHSALCAMEELGRVGVLNSSLLLHFIDDARATMQSAAPALKVFFDRLERLTTRVAANMVDAQQMATYHRRWSLTQGADTAVRRRLLQDSTAVGVNEVLKVRRPHEAQHTRFEDSDEDRRDVVLPTTPVKDAKAASVRLSVSDVESILGIPKANFDTPKSTSSLMSFVNRVSGHVRSEFLSEFQNLGGGEGAAITDLSNLNLN